MANIQKWLQRTTHNSNGCWIWGGAVQSNGYGRVSSNSKMLLAHRAIYEALVGVIPDGMVIDHICRTRACVNPEHLEVVTQMENVMRSEITVASMNSKKDFCINGHPFTFANTFKRKDRQTRECRTCRNDAVLKFKEAHLG